MPDNRYLTACEAAERLGVSLATLYAYVSRGMLRSEPVAGHPRLRHYLREDVSRLLERKELRRDPDKASGKSLHWGTPVLDSSLTLIYEGGLYYRGRDAGELAQQASVEEVAALLWLDNSEEAASLFENSSAELPQKITDFLKQASDLSPLERCQLILPLGASVDPGAYDLRPNAVARTGTRILRLLVSAVCAAPTSDPIDQALQQAWLPGQKTAASALRAALILCADHELNVSTFSARCIASARATPYEVVIGALAALKGRRHGGLTAEVEALFQETLHTRRPEEVLINRLRLNEGLPGFGHPLYPNGDPRATLLLTIARTFGSGEIIIWSDNLIEAAHRLTGDQPTIDFALVTLAHALGLPEEGPLILFSLGRTMGWIAHAIEQYADSQLIRPRARYIGPLPKAA